MVSTAPLKPVPYGIAVRISVRRTPLQCRPRSTGGFPRREPQYNRFQVLQAIWYLSPVFRYSTFAIVGILGVFYVTHLEKVPVGVPPTMTLRHLTWIPSDNLIDHQVTGRTRFNAMSPEREQAISQLMYDQTMQGLGQKILPQWHASSRMVQRVLDRLIPASGLEDAKWEVYVIDEPNEANAFVIPGYLSLVRRSHGCC